MTDHRSHDVLIADLLALGRTVVTPDAASVETIADAVLARLALGHPPVDSATSSVSAARPGAWRAGRAGELVERLRVALAGRGRRAVAVAVVVLLGLVAAPPVRAAVAEWFGFGGVRVRIEPGSPPSTAPPPPTVPAPDATTDASHDVTVSGSLADAAVVLGFAPLVPAELGPPQGIDMSADRRMVSMSWTKGGDGTVRLDQWAADLDGLFAKTARAAQFTNVGENWALWFDEPHEVVLLAPDGSTRTESARLAGQTLIWMTQTTTLRLEGDLTLDRAVEIAASAR
jgi:hypothetical protein